MSVVESLDKTHYFTVANAFFPLVFPAENSLQKTLVLPHQNKATLSNSKIFAKISTDFH